MKHFIFLLAALVLYTNVFCQTGDTSIHRKLLKELSVNACKCIDSISVVNKQKAEVVQKINHCIDEQTTAFQLGAKLSNIDNLTALANEKDGKKEINISINTDKESNEYKKYYFELETYLMANCASLKEKIASNDRLKSTSLSSNKKALEWYSKGLDVTKQEDYKKAIDYYHEALKIDPQFAFAWDNIGICYRRLQQYDKALEAYQKSLEVDPTGTMPLQNIPVVYQYMKEYQKAIIAYEKLAELDKDNPEIFYGIGNIYANNLQDFEKALSYMCKAYNLYIAQKSPYRTDAEKIINLIYGEMKKEGKTSKFNEILKEHHIVTQ